MNTTTLNHQEQCRISTAKRAEKLREFEKGRRTTVSPSDILAIVLHEYDIGYAWFAGSGRSRRMVEAREAYVWLAFNTTRYSYSEIAERVTGNSHTGAMAQHMRAEKKYATKAKDSRGLKTNAVFDQMLKELAEALETTT